MWRIAPSAAMLPKYVAVAEAAARYTFSERILRRGAGRAHRGGVPGSHARRSDGVVYRGGARDPALRGRRAALPPLFSHAWSRHQPRGVAARRTTDVVPGRWHGSTGHLWAAIRPGESPGGARSGHLFVLGGVTGLSRLRASAIAARRDRHHAVWDRRIRADLLRSGQAQSSRAERRRHVPRRFGTGCALRVAASQLGRECYAGRRDSDDIFGAHRRALASMVRGRTALAGG